jgi:hypothetical protein
MKRSPAVAWQEFRDRVAELGGQVIEPEWLGVNTPHRVTCEVGHEVTPMPARLRRGGGLCRACAGKDPKTAWLAFQQRVTEAGGVVVEGGWLGCQTPHRIICKDGHESSPRPNDVQSRGGICRTCAGNDTSTAERTFRERIAEVAGFVTEPSWLGAKIPHRVICANGHQCRPRPSDVNKGHGVCLTCAGKDPAVTEQAFCEGIAALGGRVVEPAWLGARKLHRIICANGHTTMAHPITVTRGGSPCAVCAGRGPEQVWQAFKDRVSALGGLVIEPRWLGSDVPHRVICKAGHLCIPRPGPVGGGQGICRYCTHSEWDIFYVVANDDANRVKFGITTNDPRQRLAEHKRRGYARIIRTMTGLPDAATLERVVQSGLRDGGLSPVWGREYYDIAALPVILDIADNWPGVGGVKAA